MKITKVMNGKELTVAIDDSLDTVTAPELDAALKASFDDIDSLVLDFRDLDYISSAGLRVLMNTHRVMSKKGGMKITNINEVIAEVFDVTGLTVVLNIV